ncbi:maleylpyruvate isomerase family mycothiol-dependent enzyme [Actinacidiphila yanglinensis]|uniref:maleylpyruvate isomerase family mycothiol-dependent enzyme n=1 Tax=Actinacidiphila yanglinensis TaxID=310779 RepID=UPI001F37CBE7|nr:maleylpyruvate isomerase family mycothiol-dependent enzyme [Actinacidiphila yanglinensis]
MTDTTPVDLQEALAAGQLRLRSLLPGLTDEALRAPSVLPGWSRGHVLTHLEGVGLALARQARYALRGTLIDVYDGGRAARDAAIEAGHRRPVQQLAPALADALDEVEASWSPVGPDDWERPVRYRDGVLRDAALAWWRELEIHTADAGLGYGTQDWPVPLCTHLVGFLAPRIPEGFRVTLTATDTGFAFSHGAGEPLPVEGRLTDIAAWLAGRVPSRPLIGAPLPVLGNWP